MFYKGFDKKLKGADKTSSSIVKKKLCSTKNSILIYQRKCMG